MGSHRGTVRTKFMGRARRSLIVTAASGVVAFLSFLGLAACASTDKDEIETTLLSLPKNERMRDHGLLRETLDVRLGDEVISAEMTYVHVRPRSPVYPPRRPIVLVHGTPSSVFTWAPLVFGEGDFPGLIETLPDRDIYVLDIVGHGITRTEAPPYSFQRCADWLAAFLEHKNLRDAIVAGNSYGGEFVWRAALDHPDRIDQVVLLDSSGFPRNDDEWLPEEVAMREMSLAYVGYVLNSRDRIETALAPHFPGGVSSDQIEEVFQVCDNSDNWEAMVDLARDENGARSGELSGLTQPTLLIWGADDEAYGVERFARLFETSIPNARLAVVEASGHYPQESQPAEVARLLAEFLDER
jgi:pimeloyl-ACP methyl ester carboxylesterase